MLSFLLAVHFVLALSIIGLIMLQKHDSDGALGSSGGGAASGMFTARGQANILTQATSILMTIFVLNCLVLAKMVKNTPTQGSVIDRVEADQQRLREEIQKKKAEEDREKEAKANETNKKTDTQSPATKNGIVNNKVKM